MIGLRRFLVFQTLLLWQGGFLFYTAVVVPIGTNRFGAEGQGTVTARVTDVLNAVGVVGVAVLAVELGLSRDPSQLRTAVRWWLWGVALLSQALLLYLHVLMDAFMDPGRTRVVIRPPFYPVHRLYLWASTAQWLACFALTALTVAAWRAEDRGPPVAA
jgi:hypothetical protein